MSRNGSGTYSLPSGNPVVTGTVISSTWWNNTGADLATALTQSLAYDGQTTPVANLPMGTYRHTGVGNAVNRTDYAALGQVQDGAPNYVATVGGTADVITFTPSPAITSYAAGQVFRFIASGANTTNVTVNVSGLGAKAVTKNGTTALVSGDIPSGALIEITYDGTQFQVTKIKQGTSSVYDVGTSGATLGLLNANKTDSGTNTYSGGNTHSGANTFSGNNTHSGTETFTGAITNQNIYNYAATSGTDTYTASLSPAIVSYMTGAHYFISFGNANTSTTPTLNLNSLGAKTIVKEGSAALVAGDIPAGHIGILEYNGTNMVLTNPKYGSTTAANGCSLVLLNPGGTSFSASSGVIIGQSAGALTINFSTYDYYEFTLERVTMSAVSDISCRIYTDGGTTPVTTNYDSFMYGLDQGGSALSISNSLGASMKIATQLRNSSSSYCTITAILHSPSDSSAWKNFEFRSIYQANSGGNIGHLSGGGVWQGANTAINGIDFIPSSGNFTGVLYAYARKKS